MFYRYKERTFNIEVTNPEQDFYIITAFDNDATNLGEITFVTKKNSYDIITRVYIYKIAVKKNYWQKGVGRALITSLEKFCFDNNCFSIDGKFYPENDYAKTFYEKNGYEIYRDGYEQYISKFLVRDNKEKVEECFVAKQNLRVERSEEKDF